MNILYTYECVMCTLYIQLKIKKILNEKTNLKMLSVAT